MYGGKYNMDFVGNIERILKIRLELTTLSP